MRPSANTHRKYLAIGQTWEMKKRKRIASQRTKVNGETYISLHRASARRDGGNGDKEKRTVAIIRFNVLRYGLQTHTHTHTHPATADTRKHYIQFQQFYNFAAIGIASVARCEQTAAAAQKIGENGNRKKNGNSFLLACGITIHNQERALSIH